ncbi:MAG: hypothetical protein EA359_18545 [Balneolaceae bacterium]|nr:MAG: hypothetical protein EA359_18545 [Balneolaceae bacterium]
MAAEDAEGRQLENRIHYSGDVIHEVPSFQNTALDTTNAVLDRFRRFQKSAESDFSLTIGYHTRMMNPSFIRDSDLFIKSGGSDQYLYLVEIKPAVIFYDRVAIEFSYSFIPDQSNFSEPVVLDFESSRTVANEMIRYQGHSISMSAAYFLPVTQAIRAGLHLGYSRVALNLDERVRYHPADPFALNYRVVRLPVNNSRVIISSPFASLSAEFQLRRVRLNTGYEIHLFRPDQVSMSGFYISLGVRLGDLL